MSSDKAEIFINQVDVLKTKLEYLERLASLNVSNQLTEHKKTAINIRKLLFDIYSGKSNKWLQSSPLFEGISDLVINSPALSSIENDFTVSNELYKQVELELTALEDKVYDNFQKIKEMESNFIF